VSAVRRTEMLNFRATPEEKATIDKAVDRAVGIEDRSEWLRVAALYVAENLTIGDFASLGKAIRAIPDHSEFVRDQAEQATAVLATEADVKALALKLSARLSTRNARLEAERQLGLR
jgi:hypothetical protein